MSEHALRGERNVARQSRHNAPGKNLEAVCHSDLNTILLLGVRESAASQDSVRVSHLYHRVEAALHANCLANVLDSGIDVRLQITGQRSYACALSGRAGQQVQSQQDPPEFDRSQDQQKQEWKHKGKLNDSLPASAPIVSFMSTHCRLLHECRLFHELHFAEVQVRSARLRKGDVHQALQLSRDVFVVAGQLEIQQIYRGELDDAKVRIASLPFYLVVDADVYDVPKALLNRGRSRPSSR